MTLEDCLERRDLGKAIRSSAVRGAYGLTTWVNNLDIVNELRGHAGCVNALSWSRSGRLLASGSDDQYLNVYLYQPESITASFALSTKIATGHTQNIFSVKFMPHTNDRTLVTAAGDCEVRIFDIEYSGSSTGPTLGFDDLRNGVRFLDYRNTHTRIYKSHSDRVKRIVTESSPHLFLTCSEDGEVRQWDLRQPSSAYPSPHIRTRSDVPPPLISYKRYHLELNTLSCSPSQPHYIALGGTHLHCFLHDRRMLGRDLINERGQGTRLPFSRRDDELLSQATRCVRRFAPGGQSKMKPKDNGHITACKISDANPNELIVSWSGDGIYSFDLTDSPDARDMETRHMTQGFSKDGGSGAMVESSDRKRKREESSNSAHTVRRIPRAARINHSGGRSVLRVQYQNGNRQEIPMNMTGPSTGGALPASSSGSSLDTEQQRSRDIAQSVVEIRKEIFDLKTYRTQSSNSESVPNTVEHNASYKVALDHATTVLPKIDRKINNCPILGDPSDEEERRLRILCQNRFATEKFVQASGTLATALWKLQVAASAITASPGDLPPVPGVLPQFSRIHSIHNDRRFLTQSTHFSYEFLKAILLYLNGGLGSLLEGFKRLPNQPYRYDSFPLAVDAPISAIGEELIPYLRSIAGSRPIRDVDASRFATDEHRILFTTEKLAVDQFHHFIRLSTPLATELTRTEAQSSSAASEDRRNTSQFWGFKVGRGVLLNASSGVDFVLVDRAFGGLGVPDNRDEVRSQEDIDPHEAEPIIGRFEYMARPASPDAELEIPPPYPSVSSYFGVADEDTISVQDIRSVIADRLALSILAEVEDDVENDNTHSEDDQNPNAALLRFVYRAALDRSRLRESVDSDAPCLDHTRKYVGHCNVKTVKDVNFFGLQDEYVVSGSDCGHLFIWDKKSTRLIKTLKGDSDVVNVVQGHPYEPMLAVSGIDRTIKIFSPDRSALWNAREGVNVLHDDEDDDEDEDEDEDDVTNNPLQNSEGE